MFAKPATVAIEFENNGMLCPGAQLKGRVLLTVHKEIAAEFLTMRFHGVENTRVNIRENSWAYEDSIIFSVINVLETFIGPALRPNTYTYLFDIPIPPHIPGSQKWKKRGENFKISYHCETILHRKGMLTWNVQASSVVEIHDEPYFSLPSAMYIGPVTTDAKSMFGSPAGSKIMYGAQVHTTYANPNKVLRVNYAIRNASTSRVKALEICLKQVVWYTACGFFKFQVTNIFKKRFDAAILRIETVDNNNRGNGDPDYNYKALLQRINEGEFGFDVPIGAVNQSTFVGKLCMVKYELSVKLKTTFGTPNGKVKIPIMINRNGTIYNPVYRGLMETAETVVVGTEIVEGFVEGIEEEGKVDIIPPGNSNPRKHKNGNNGDLLTPELDLFIAPPETATIDTAATVDTAAAAVCMLEVGYDTVEHLTNTMKTCHEVEEINVIRDWLARSQDNVNLLTPDTLFLLYKCIKGYYNFYTISRAIGEAMSHQNSRNRCTCRHIAEAGKGASLASKEGVCNTFAPYCVDRRNARESFLITGVERTDMKKVMMHYI
jgi:hypothetical protein